MKCNLIWFTAPKFLRIFQNLFKEKLTKGTVKIIALPIEEFVAYKKLNPVLWTITHEKDYENEVFHTPGLYAVWYEKKEFINRAIMANPFKSDLFVWCDAGIGRNEMWLPALKDQFPIGEHIPRGRVLVLQINPFKKDDWNPDGDGLCGASLDKRATVAGVILASDAAGWARWSKAYDRIFMKYVLAGRFYGKDQNIMASMILEDRSLAVRIEAPPFLNEIDKWFYLLLFLGGVRVLTS
jgi:hypothetical protein